MTLIVRLRLVQLFCREIYKQLGHHPLILFSLWAPGNLPRSLSSVAISTPGVSHRVRSVSGSTRTCRELCRFISGAAAALQNLGVCALRGQGRDSGIGILQGCLPGELSHPLEKRALSWGGHSSSVQESSLCAHCFWLWAAQRHS